jgi:chromate transporter
MRARLQAHGWMIAVPLAAAAVGGIPALVWVAFKVGALSYGGGFVIIPLMQGDAVHTYHWMTSGQFLNAVALGQVTPGPVVATVAAVGYAAHGVGGGVLAAFVAFLPSFLFVLIGGRHFDRLRGNWRAQRFLDGAGPAAVGAIFGSAIPLAAALNEAWQFGLLAAAAVALLVGRLGIVTPLVACGVIGGIGAIAGAPIPH